MTAPYFSRDALDSRSFVLGTAQIGSAYGINNSWGKPSLADAFTMLAKAHDNGITELDTAEAYGESETVIGEFSRKYPEKQFRIDTKLSHFAVEAGATRDISAAIEKKLIDTSDRLGNQPISIYYLHSFALCKDRNLMDALDRLRRGGLFESLGVSVYEPTELAYILREEKGRVNAVQIPFNCFNASQWLDSGLLSQCEEANVQLLARSVYVQGMVFKDADDPFVEKLGISRAVKKFAAICEAYSVTRSKLALDFVRQTKGISKILLGAETVSQIEEDVSLFQASGIWDKSSYDSFVQMGKGIPQRALDPRTWS